MWINFSCSGALDYHIKIYVGGINAISGEPATEDASTRLRRHVQLARRYANANGSTTSPLQDYIVVPAQYWFVTSMYELHGRHTLTSYIYL
jgi:hypothetical protein